MSRHDTIDEIEDKYMDRIKELIAERDCWIDTANMFKDEQQKMIESQAAEITELDALRNNAVLRLDKYKALKLPMNLTYIMRPC